MTDAFIAYSRRNLDFVERKAEALIANGKEPWFDRRKDPLVGIPDASEWWEEIEEGIEAADNFIFVITPDSVTSPYCNAEMAHARRHSKRRWRLWPGAAWLLAYTALARADRTPPA